MKNSVIKAYMRLCISILLILLLIIAVVDIFMFKIGRDKVDIYKVEIGRVEHELLAHAGDPGFEPDVSAYETILGVKKYVTESDRITIDYPSNATVTDESIPGLDSASGSENKDYFITDSVSAADPEFFYSDNAYVIRDIAGTLYRIEYEADPEGESRRAFLNVNIVIAGVVLAVAIVLFYIYLVIIRNFHKLSEYPSELAKGNLTIPLKESRNKYFGRFLWGLDMLREKLEEEKNRNLELQKEKNLFLLSL